MGLSEFCAVKFPYFCVKSRETPKYLLVKSKQILYIRLANFCKFCFCHLLQLSLYNSTLEEFLEYIIYQLNPNIEPIFRKIHRGKPINKNSLTFQGKTGLVTRASIMKIHASVRKLHALAPVAARQITVWSYLKSRGRSDFVNPTWRLVTINCIPPKCMH